MRFNGPEYDPQHDKTRLSKQHERIKELMKDGRWRTIQEISEITNDPGPSVSAQLRHLRKERFGGFLIERRSRGNRIKGLFEYRLAVSADKNGQMELLKKGDK